MKTRRCDNHVLVTSVEDYPYTESGLTNVILKNIPVQRCRACGEQMPHIARIKHVHRQIALGLVAQDDQLSGEAFRFLRKEMRLSATALADQMGVHKVTLSRWETNTEPMSGLADRLIRHMYLVREAYQA